MDDALRRRRLIGARVGTLATVTADGRPHVVPCCYAIDGEVVYTAVDEVKPKSTLDLRRLANIRARPAAALLVDEYDDDWSALWWIRVDGIAQVAEAGSRAHAAGIELLTAKYEQYRRRPPAGPMITLAIERWVAWP